MSPVIAGALGTPLQSAGAPGNGTSAIEDVDITGTPTGGTFKLSFRSELTVDIAFDAAIAAVELAIEALGSIGAGNCTVTGVNPNFVFTFTGDLAKLDVEDLFVLAENLLTGGSSPSVTITDTTPGVTAFGRGMGPAAMAQDTASGDIYANEGTALEPSWAKVGLQT